MDKKILDDLIQTARRRDAPVSDGPVTREELERQAKEAADEETIELKREYEEAKQAYEDAREEAYQRNLEELLEENGFSDC